MKKLKWIIPVWAILLMGCAQPNFDPQDKYVLYANGKAYAIPFGANYNAHIRESGYRMIRSAGVICSNDGISWHEKRFSKKMNLSRNASQLIKSIRYGYQKNLFGCAEPLTKEEYKALAKKQSRTVRHQCKMCKNKI